MFTKVVLNNTHASKVVAVDVLHSSIAWAKRHWKRNKKIRFMVTDAHDLPFATGTFDAAFALEMLEHVFKPDQVLREIKRVLKKGGYAIFLVPSDSGLFKLVWFLWSFYRGRIWKHTHIQTYRNDYLVEVSKKVGFEVEVSKKFLLGMLHAVRVRKK
jgi:ubiquinone/menaquinone biosynthesis C-methylase UbiE